MAITNFGVTLTMDSVNVGELRSVEAPEVSEEKLESTTHGSTAKEYIPAGLNDNGDMTLTMNYVDTATSGLWNAKMNHTVHEFVVTFPNSETITFSGFVSSFKPETADATGIDVLTATVVISPVGPIS